MTSTDTFREKFRALLEMSGLSWDNAVLMSNPPMSPAFSPPTHSLPPLKCCFLLDFGDFSEFPDFLGRENQAIDRTGRTRHGLSSTVVNVHPGEPAVDTVASPGPGPVIARSTQEYTGADRSAQECVGVHRSAQERTGADRRYTCS